MTFVIRQFCLVGLFGVAFLSVFEAQRGLLSPCPLFDPSAPTNFTSTAQAQQEKVVGLSSELIQAKNEILRLQTENGQLRQTSLSSKLANAQHDNEILRLKTENNELRRNAVSSELVSVKEAILRLEKQKRQEPTAVTTVSSSKVAEVKEETTTEAQANEEVQAEELKEEDNNKSPPVQITSSGRFPACTEQQMEIVLQQTGGDPLGKKAKTRMSELTACPDDANWLEEYYLHDNLKASENFLAINIGCNKGFDSLKLLRMGTRQDSVQKKPWDDAAFKKSYPAICKAHKGGDLELPVDAVPRKGDVFCVEPMPGTIRALQTASEATQMAAKGLHIVNAAVANENGVAQFPNINRPGLEDVGIGSKKMRGATRVDVPMMTLDEFGTQHMAAHADQNINILLIDTEGFDFDVMKGGKQVLSRTEYLEFEFHDRGKWAKQKLMDAIDMLDELDFTCYWTGKQKLWRVTGCWQEHFGIHDWTNVACVHGQRMPELAQKMETVFLNTIRQN